MSAELYGSVTLAIATGVATFFAPCSYALLPGYVGYYVASTDSETVHLSGALSRGGAASGGALGTFLLLGAVAAVASDLIEAVLPAAEVAVGVALVAFGVALFAGKTGSIHVPFPKRRSSVVGFGLFGAMYALASAACVLPLFLAFVVRSLTLSATGTAAVLVAYGAVVATMLLAVTVVTAVGRNAGTNRLAITSGRVVPFAGLLLVVAGIGQLAVAW